jgi:phosphoribosyl-AMP cyclohydrolase
MKLIDFVKFDSNGLVPVIAQHFETNQVLMLAYMNKETLLETLQTGRMVYYSRSRKKRWLKGETSGHFQTVREVYLDCDGDTLLFKIEQKGAACHEGYFSCFFRKRKDDNWQICDKKIDE